MKSIKSFDYDDAIRSVQTLSKNTPIKISGEPAEIEVVIFWLQTNKQKFFALRIQYLIITVLQIFFRFRLLPFW